MSDEWDNAVPAPDLKGPRARKAKLGAKKEGAPPNSPEAERGLLGCVLLSPLECLDDCQEMGVNEEWFYDLRHQLIWHCLTRLALAGQPISVPSIVIRLRDSGDLDRVGGAAYIDGLLDCTPAAANLTYFLDLVREKAQCRLALTAFEEAKAHIHENELNAGSVLAQAQKAIEDLAEMVTEKRDCTLKSLLGPLVKTLEDDYHRGSAQIKGLTTGIEYLDKILCGIGQDNGNMIVISARPGIGKTSLAMQIAEHVALDHKWFTPAKNDDGQVVLRADGRPERWEEHRGGLAVGVFSLEMSASALAKRLLFQRAKADMQRFRNGFANGDDFKKLAVAGGELAGAKIFVDDTGRCTIDELKARARKMHRTQGVKLFVIDYIQLLRVARRDRRNDRREELEEISGELFKLGKELNTPFIILAQMNRDFEKDPNRIPRLSDLKDCGAIEQDADLIMFLYGPKRGTDEEEAFEAMVNKVYGDDWAVKPTRVNLLVAKNRFGLSEAQAQLMFQKSSTLFLDFVAFKKEHGFKDPAKGERKKKGKDDDLL